MITLRSRAPLFYISAGDAAIDRSAPDWKERLQQYAVTLDRKHLPLIDGATPTVFQLVRLTRSQDHYVESRRPEEQACERVAFGLVAAQEFRWDDGQEIFIKRVRSDLGEKVDAEQLAKIYEGAKDLVGELAFVLERMSSPDPLGGQRSEPSPT